jgi:tRNA (adenine22-N1)-methyltransferase
MSKDIKAPRLSDRLLGVLSMVPECETAADIGCDHAKLAISLIMRGHAKRVFASDVREGPLLAAVRNIEKYGCAGKVSTVLAPGLDGVIKFQVQVYIIAGMGGEMIASILDKHRDMFTSGNTFVLQPMSSVEDLRRYLYKTGFFIEDELLCTASGRLYSVIRAKYDGVQRSDDQVYFYIGRRLIENRDPLLLRLIDARISEHEKILQGLSDEKYKQRALMISALIDDMKRIKEEIYCESRRDI